MAIDVATFLLRFPEFTGRDDAAIQYWIDDAGRIVTADWSEREPATLELAAHNLAGTPSATAGAAGQIPAGVTSFRSAAFSLNFSEAAANAVVAGGYGSTPYGKRFQVMLRRERGGPQLVTAGC